MHICRDVPVVETNLKHDLSNTLQVLEATDNDQEIGHAITLDVIIASLTHNNVR